MFGCMGVSQAIPDIECDIMTYCLKESGEWWANHFFYNKEVKELYSLIRSKPLNEVWSIIKKDK